MSNNSYQDESNSNEDSNPNQKKQHRRGKNEIERDFVCGWPDCGKQYGTNAALYTHTKNKHKSIEHPNTKRPNSESLVGKKGRPFQSLQESKGFPINSNEPPKDLKRKLEVIKIWSDSRFIDMIHLIGMFGDSDNTNQFTREMEDESSLITEENITQYIKKLDKYLTINLLLIVLIMSKDFQQKLLIFGNKKFKKNQILCFYTPQYLKDRLLKLFRIIL